MVRFHEQAPFKGELSWGRDCVNYGWNFVNFYPQKFKIGEPVMASVKKGTMTRPPQWWKHLRDWKRVFWKSERQAHKKEIAGGIT